MKNIFIACLFALPLLLVSAAPLESTESSCGATDNFSQDVSAPTTPVDLANSCTCRGRIYNDVDTAKYSPAHFSNFERIPFARCPGARGLTRWKLNNLDRAVYMGSRFCGCITHQGARRRNGFVAC